MRILWPEYGGFLKAFAIEGLQSKDTEVKCTDDVFCRWLRRGLSLCFLMSPKSKLFKGGYIGYFMREYHRGYQGV